MEEKKDIQIKGELVRVRYNFPNTIGYVHLKNEQGEFEVMCEHRILQNIIETESLGSIISFNTSEGFFRKIK